MGAVMDRGPAKGSMRSLLLAIANSADDFGFACPGIELLAKSCCWDERTVIRNSGRLEAEGWMRVERKVLGGRGNVYFIDIQKLGVIPTSTARHSPMWADMQRLMRALNTGDKLYQRGGRLKFEKPADGAGEVVTGDLFGDENTGDILSPEFGRAEPQNGGTIDRIAAIASVTGDLGAETASEDGNSGDKMSPDNPHQCHLTGDILSSPFKYLTVTEPLHNRKTPQPPASGGSGLELSDQVSAQGVELVLPHPDAQPGDADFALNVGLASRWVLRRCGISNSRMEKHVTAALTLRMKSTGEDLPAVAQLAAANNAAYTAAFAAGDMRFGPWSVPAFFGQGHWTSSATWPWVDAARRSPSVARYDDSPEAEAFRAAAEAAANERRAAWTESNADQIAALDVPEEAKAALSTVVTSLRAVAGSLRDGEALDVADQRLCELEAAMLDALVAHVPAAKAANDEIDARASQLPLNLTRAQFAAQLVPMRRKKICDAVDAPYLSLFHMPDFSSTA